MTDGPVAGGGDGFERGGELDVDDALDLLSDRYRRHVLACLDGLPEPVALEALTDRVAGREFRQPPEEVSMLTRTEIATLLHHNHLPHLDEVGLIAYDGEDGKVTEIAIGEPLAGFLDMVRRHEV